MKKVIFGIAAAAFVLIGAQSDVFAFDHKVKKEATFKVRVENISSADGQTTVDGAKYPFALSPGLYVVTMNSKEIFKEGKHASAGLEAQAEDGNPAVLSKSLLTKVGSNFMGIYNTPIGSDMPAPILPGGAFEFTFHATEGMKLNFVNMFGQSNDLFYAPKEAIALFDRDGNPLTGDITDRVLLWDAGTEINQAPGVGADQAPRQKGPNTGAAENGVVGPVKDDFAYPETKSVLRVTITVE